MKKSIFILAVLLASVNVTQAQTKSSTTKTPPKFTNNGYKQGFRLGLGLSGGFDTGQDYEGAVGADVRLQYDFSRKTSITFTPGYTHLFQKGDDAGFVPVKLGFKMFLGNQFYWMGEAGAALGVKGDLDNSVLLAPSFGFANKYIDVSLRYENYLDYKLDQIGLRIAYGFSLKK